MLELFHVAYCMIILTHTCAKNDPQIGREYMPFELIPTEVHKYEVGIGDV